MSGPAPGLKGSVLGADLLVNQWEVLTAWRSEAAASLNRAVLAAFLYLLDIGSLRSFWPLHQLEPNPIPLLERPISISHNSGIVDEHIGPILTANKPKSFGVVEPFDPAFHSIRLQDLWISNPEI